MCALRFRSESLRSCSALLPVPVCLCAALERDKAGSWMSAEAPPAKKRRCLDYDRNVTRDMQVGARVRAYTGVHGLDYSGDFPRGARATIKKVYKLVLSNRPASWCVRAGARFCSHLLVSLSSEAYSE